MGDESINLERTRFDLSDLGLLSGETEREFEIVTRNAGIILQGCASVFCLLDAAHSSVFLRSSFVPRGRRLLPERLERSNSLFARIIEANKCVRIADVGDHPELDGTVEASFLSYKSVLSEPVYGPAREQIGALVVLSNVPRKWAELERRELRDQALLLSRHVLLRASLETLKRMSREREAFSKVGRFRN
ncbi:MAG: hypothetical protein HKP37_10060 [Boseongicola sp.]|nr:hypothetical protein [Boseongicola sp.]NNL19070.1 hypothetical protein [Boseongicola sp.]